MTSNGAEKTEAASNTIEEVIVSARKRDENLQDVPISVTAFTADDLEAMSLTSLTELGQFITNFSFFNIVQMGRNASIVYIRGVGPVHKVVAVNQAPLVRLLNRFVDPPYGDAFLTDSNFTTFSNGSNANDLNAWGMALTVDWNLGP